MKNKIEINPEIEVEAELFYRQCEKEKKKNLRKLKRLEVKNKVPCLRGLTTNTSKGQHMEKENTTKFIRPAGAFPQTPEGWKEYQKQFEEVKDEPSE